MSSYSVCTKWNNIRPLAYSAALTGATYLLGAHQQACQNMEQSENEMYSTSQIVKTGAFVISSVILIGGCLYGYPKLPEWGKKKVSDLGEMLKNNAIATVGSAAIGYGVSGTAGAIQSLGQMVLFNGAQKIGERRTANPKLIETNNQLKRELNAAISAKRETEKDLTTHIETVYGERNDQYRDVAGQLELAMNKIILLEGTNAELQNDVKRLQATIREGTKQYFALQLQMGK